MSAPGGQWQHFTVAAIRSDGRALGMMFTDRTWCWIPLPPIAVKAGNRVSVYRYQPDGFTVRCTIGEMEVPTYYQNWLKGLHR